MNVITTLFVIILLLPGLSTWAVYKFIPRLLWCIPIVAIMISSSLVFKDILSITSETTFVGKWGLYFHNDWSMGFYLLYLPIVVTSIVFTVIAYLIKQFKRRRESVK